MWVIRNIIPLLLMVTGIVMATVSCLNAASFFGEKAASSGVEEVLGFLVFFLMGLATMIVWGDVPVGNSLYAGFPKRKPASLFQSHCIYFLMAYA